MIQCTKIRFFRTDAMCKHKDGVDKTCIFRKTSFPRSLWMPERNCLLRQVTSQNRSVYMLKDQQVLNLLTVLSGLSKLFFTLFDNYLYKYLMLLVIQATRWANLHVDKVSPRLHNSKLMLAIMAVWQFPPVKKINNLCNL